MKLIKFNCILVWFGKAIRSSTWETQSIYPQMHFRVSPGTVPSQWLLGELPLCREPGARAPAAFYVHLSLSFQLWRTEGSKEAERNFSPPKVWQSWAPRSGNDLVWLNAGAGSQQLVVDCFKEQRYYQPSSFLKRKHLQGAFNSFQMNNFKVLRKVCFKKAKRATSGR